MKSKTIILLKGSRRTTVQKIPLFSSSVQAGFPSHADESVDMMLDLNRLVVKNPATTFFLKAEGNSMEGVGIFSGDILIVDRSIEARNNDIVVAILFDELTVKRLRVKESSFFLVAENDEYEPIEITEEMESSIWGVVTHSLRTFKP